jgi:cephalosporin hydroxylase
MNAATGGKANESDPQRVGSSLANLRELILDCLDATGAMSVAQVGPGSGELARVLLDRVTDDGTRVIAIGPSPAAELVELGRRNSRLEVFRGGVDAALGAIDDLDAVIIDGDPNYHTVSEVLRVIDERAAGSQIPLLMVHNVGWPYGRRDVYPAPERIPDGRRQPVVERPFLFPNESGVVGEGLPMYAAAEREGGPRNGVLAAVEEFVDRREQVRVATLAPFFGLAVLWHCDAPWAPTLAEVVEQWDRNPLLERIEENRVHHLATSYSRAAQLMRTTAALNSQEAETARLERLTRRRDGGSEADSDGDSDTDAATISWFQELWARRQVVLKSTFLGVNTWQNPLDAWITQEIVSEVRPDLIVETGTFRGGSAALWAFLLEMTNPAGRVVSIDLKDRIDGRVRELDVVRRRVEFLQGSSTDPQIVSEVAKRAAGKDVLAILDSDHSTEHVLGELTAYAPLIGLGSYIIVQDVLAGPDVAIERFLEEDDRFEPDRARERFMVTNCAGGFLKRVR